MSSQSPKIVLIADAVTAGDRDRLSQLAVSEGGLLSDEVRELGLSADSKFTRENGKIEDIFGKSFGFLLAMICDLIF